MDEKESSFFMVLVIGSRVKTFEVLRFLGSLLALGHKHACPSQETALEAELTVHVSVDGIDRGQTFGIAHPELAVSQDAHEHVDIVQRVIEEVVIYPRDVIELGGIKHSRTLELAESLFVFRDDSRLGADNVSDSAIVFDSGTDCQQTVEEGLMEVKAALSEVPYSVVSIGEDLVAFLHIGQDALEFGKLFNIECQLFELSGLTAGTVRGEGDEEKNERREKKLFHGRMS